jgi:cytochrome c oxidase subunit 2
MANAFTPESGGSPNADDIDSLYKIVLYVGILMFLIVEGALIWSLVRHRERRRGPDPAQIRGNTPLELGWTVGAAVILVVITAVTFVYLKGIEDPPASGPDGLASGVQVASIDQPNPPGKGKSLNIRVNGQQYLWRYDYPGKEVYSYYEMVVPINTTVTLDITSSDVQHSWWVPKLGGKADAVPGHVNQTWFKISKPGLYKGQCAELCGENHADMRNVVRAVQPEEYMAFVERQARDIKASQKALSAQRKKREREQQ